MTKVSGADPAFVATPSSPAVSTKGFNPGELVGRSVVVSSATLYRWASVVSGAAGTLIGVDEAFTNSGMGPLETCAEAAANLQVVRGEIVGAIVGAIANSTVQS